MNINNLMAQARKMQSDMQKIKNEIDETVFEVEKNGIKISANGKGEVIKIDINDSDLMNDKEMLEDLLIVNLNEINTRITSEKSKKLGKVSGGLEGLF